VLVSVEWVSYCLMVYWFPKWKKLFSVEGILSSRDTEVGIATGYGLHDHGVGVPVPVEPRMFAFPICPDRLWGPPSLCLWPLP
jgi:hypothetical protein